MGVDEAGASLLYADSKDTEDLAWDLVPADFEASSWWVSADLIN